MTRTQWFTLPESQRDAIRQASAEKSWDGWDERPRRPRTDEERARDFWAARDAYRVESAVMGFGLLLLGGLGLVVCGIVSGMFSALFGR